MGKELEFVVTISLYTEDDSDVCVNMTLTDREYSLLKKCSREGKDMENYRGLKTLYKRICEEAWDECEMLSADDIYRTDVTFGVSIPEEVYDEAQKEADTEEPEEEEDSETAYQRRVAEHADDKFAIESREWKVLSFNSDFRKEVLNRYLAENDISRKSFMAKLRAGKRCRDEDFVSDMETLGVLLYQGKITFVNMKDKQNMEIQYLLENLGFRLEFDGETWNFEDEGVYYIN